MGGFFAREKGRQMVRVLGVEMGYNGGKFQSARVGVRANYSDASMSAVTGQSFA